jgi:hypothetical protein
MIFWTVPLISIAGKLGTPLGLASAMGHLAGDGQPGKHPVH